MQLYLLAGFFGSLLILLAAGVPVSFSLGFLSIIGILVFVGPSALSIIANDALHYSTMFELTCIAEFILMAEIIRLSGLAERAFNGVSKWVSWLPGGLANGSIAFSGAFAAITGSSAANALTTGLIFIPQMLKRGYDKRLTLGAIAGGGSLGVLIPPSINMILYCVLTLESVGRVFIAGVMPGIMMVGLFISYVIVRARIQPNIAPRETGVSWKDRVSSLPGFLPIIALMIAVLGGIYTGICTPSEAAAIGVGGSIVISLVYGSLNLANLRDALLRTSRTFGFYMLLIISAICFTFVLTALQIPQQLTQTMLSVSVSPWVILIAFNIFVIFLGCFLDAGSILVLTLPVFYPVVTALGFDSIWFAIILLINLELSNITPPVGLNLYVLKSIAPPEVSLGDIIRGAIPFMLLLAIGMVLVMVFPQIAIWLPNTMK